MQYNRRTFIKITGGLSGSLALGSMIGLPLFSDDSEEARKLKKFGIQLYTLRDDMPKDPKAVLRQLAANGYKQIESYEGKDGMFWGMTPADFKRYMDDLGMKIVASHCDMNKDFEKKAADAASIGMTHLICPWLGPQKTLDDFKRFAATFNQRGEVCRKNGIRFAYHNHDYSFKIQDGQFPQDILMSNTDASLVDFEMDIYWVVTAGQDAEAWLKKYPNRFRLCHVKDRSKDAGADNGKNSVDLGTGIIDFAGILKTAGKKGMEYYIVEQEYYTNSTPLKSAETGAAYMKRLKV
jgi:sugar phosphate isomerase/epimerase